MLNSKKTIIFIIIFIIFNNLFSAKFIKKDTKKYSYIFAPGLTSTELQLVKYLPKFSASTGEIISSKNGIHTVNTPVSICKFAEIGLRNFTKKYLISFLNPIKYFYRLLNRKLRGQFNIDIKDKSNYNKKKSKLIKTLKSYTVIVSKINVGQKADLKCLLKTYKNHLNKYPDSNIILYGASRGAAAIFNFVAKYHPKNIKAMILEGIFDSVHNLLVHKIGYFHNFIENLICALTQYKKDGLSPLNLVNIICKKIPILLITSMADESVPYKCAINLYKILKQAGHNRVYILILKSSSHIGYICDDDIDKHNYEFAVHAFYKKWGLPYDIKLAEAGQAVFNNCQPSLEEIDQYLNEK